MDHVCLEGVLLYGFHGVRPEEQARPQPFLVDVELEADLEAAGHSDRLAETVSYSRAYQLLREVLHGPPKHLLEALAEEIAGRLLEAFPRVQRVRVQVTKVRPPVAGPVLRGASVRIQRARPQL